jgi:hypothetical protein
MLDAFLISSLEVSPRYYVTFIIISMETFASKPCATVPGLLENHTCYEKVVSCVDFPVVSLRKVFVWE